MCYHSAHSPCSVCGCPDRDNKHRNESQGETQSRTSWDFLTKTLSTEAFFIVKIMRPEEYCMKG